VQGKEEDVSAEEEFEKWWANDVVNAYTQYDMTKQAYLDATKATALRCVKICEDTYGEPYTGAYAIAKEFGL